MPINDDEIARIYKFERRPIPKYPYWYGMKKAVYEMVGLPKFFPVSCHLQHGAVSLLRKDKPDYLVTSNPYPVILLSNKEQSEFYGKEIEPALGKPVHIFGSVFPRYRRYKNIIKDPDAKGSLLFAGHSTKNISMDTDWDELIAQFKKLPSRYHPLTISIYYIDFLKGRHKKFEDAGFDVVTSGHISDEQFIDNFYKNLSKYKYVISTDIGSHLYCAVEMEIPFMIYGNAGTYYNHGKDKNGQGEIYKIISVRNFGEIYQLFTPTPEQIEQGIEITEEQRRFVHENIGTYDALPLEEVREIILQHQNKFYAKELLKSPISLPLKLYREIKAKF